MKFWQGLTCSHDARFPGCLPVILELQQSYRPVSLHCIVGRLRRNSLKELASAKPIQHAVTLREGLSLSEVAAVFAEGGWCDAEEFIGLAHDPAFLKSLGLDSYINLEGYLYPDTYYLTRKGQTTEDLLRMQVRHFFAVWNEIKTDAPPGTLPL